MDRWRYEALWIDTSRNLVGTIMTQMFWVYDGAFEYTKEGRIRGEIYKPWTDTHIKTNIDCECQKNCHF